MCGFWPPTRKTSRRKKSTDALRLFSSKVVLNNRLNSDCQLRCASLAAGYAARSAEQEANESGRVVAVHWRFKMGSQTEGGLL